MMEQKAERQDHILRAALELFLRHGYKKTSMDDVARAAGLTRQGLYFHYHGKDELLRRSVEHALDRGREAVERALAEGGPPEERLWAVLDAWFGGYVGLFTPELVPDWELHCRRLVGERVAADNAWFRCRLAEALEPAGLGADGAVAAEMLFLCGQQWKRNLSDRGEFEARMRAAIRLCCGGSRP